MAQAKRRSRKSGPVKGVGFLGWLARAVALALILWVGGFVLFVLAQPGPAAEGTMTDGVVVLTGGPKRVARGAAVLEAGLAERLLVSGVDPAVTPQEFRAASGLSPGLFACCVDLGFEADSTRSNAEEVAGWVAKRKIGSLRLVTAGYHMPRAMAELEARLPADVRVVADGVSAGLPLGAMLMEYAKFQAAWLMLRVRPA
ncbi:YdcF family protein [Sandaracinobacter sp. RS1-74]|uniref:YdcF family protein n=1 Tax=Sandaracinobacteroides sayramensis TaxID=2913411 RepID=UPI001EDA6323|nr:YdcF family protein [Sandaracinobacteroides sayramensis]MCG2841670.1 YdcF family protein [Sandaracinobacteroides sayramensis]